MLKRFSLTQKMIASFMLVASISIVVGGFGIRSLKKVSAQYSQVTEVNVLKEEKLLAMRAAMEGLMSTMIQMGLAGTPPAEITRLAETLNKYRQEYGDSEKAYLAIPFGEGEKQIYDKVSEKWGAVLGFVVDVLPMARSSEAKDKTAFATAYQGADFMKARKEFNDTLKDLLDFQAKESTEWKAKAQATAHQSILWMISTAILGMLIAAVVGVVVARKQAGILRSIADNLDAGADALSSFAAEISHASKSLLTSIDYQVTAIHETSSAVDELNSMVAKNSENATSSREVAVESDNTATDGRKAVEEMVVALGEIDKSNSGVMAQIESNNRNLSEINQLITEISGKTKVINDIVFQTKLLSFNASVEAARAGEHGKGFAVVAEEVGNLAQMSGTAAREISTILESSVRKVNQIIEETRQQVQHMVESNKDKFDHGKTVAAHCGEVLEQLVFKVQRVRAMMEEITVASREQSTGIEEITRAMASLNENTQKNAESSQQTSAASERLAQQADSLREAVRSLTSAIYGEKTKPSSEPSSDQSVSANQDEQGSEHGPEQIAS